VAQADKLQMSINKLNMNATEIEATIQQEVLMAESKF
jgi:hypothetical protein